ncbi:MAG: tRNA (guanosine(46)-N7)-methyltransferase TrmB [Candidatus Sumerlaeaceae bacterium]|nr:tRNA (guanosine(46)-N7)-methyltransferase TrmB [Candidatus Sumerlaeaceae bacterium]
MTTLEPTSTPGFLTLPELEQPLDYARLFGRNAPTELEIGAGRCDFLLGYAPTKPGVNFIGLERKVVILRRAVNKLRRTDISNIVLIAAEARHTLESYFPPASLQAVHIYFPDPWPKKKHLRRRIIDSAMPARLARIIAPNGFLHLRTDHENYFRAMEEVMSGTTDFQPISPPPDLVAVKTAFEAAFLREGKPIYHASFQRREI